MPLRLLGRVKKTPQKRQRELARSRNSGASAVIRAASPWDFPYFFIYQQDEIADDALAYYDLSKRRRRRRLIITQCNLSTWNDFCQVVHHCLGGVAVSRWCVIHPALTINRLYFNHDRYARIFADIP